MILAKKSCHQKCYCRVPWWKTTSRRTTVRVFITVNNIAIIYLEKVCTQLRIFRKEIKSTLNQELMHILGERGLLVRVIKILSLDTPKSILETGKKPKKPKKPKKHPK